MTTTDCPTLAELRSAQDSARIAHKRAILRSDPRARDAALAYLHRLESMYEDALDAEQPVEARQDNTAEYPFTIHTVDRADLAHGFHVLPGGKYPNR